jgi:branched-chain amino acid aminotransferase
MKNIHFLNGNFVNEDDLLISPRDLGFSRGYAVFEFIITSKGRPFMINRHINRLFNSCKLISLNIPWTKQQIIEWIQQTIDANELSKGEDIVMRVIISGGSSETLLLPKTPTITIIVSAHLPCPDEDYMNGVSVNLVEFDRYEPQAKTNNYAQAVREMNAAQEDVDEIIYTSNGIVKEGTRSNIFAIIDGVLLTPKTGVLKGITRDIILNDLELSIRVEEKDITVLDLFTASEVFITATGKKIMPVVKIDNMPIGNAKVGDFTKEIMIKFKEFFELNINNY